MKMRYFIYIISLFALGITSAFAQQATQGYNVSLDPGIQVIDNADGSSTIQGRFKLFDGQTPSNTLQSSELSACIDNQTVPSQITTPTSTTRKMADVVFCMDISGSMGNEIQAVKNNTNSFVQKLVAKNYDVRLGLITFGQSPAPHMRKRNNGLFYGNEQDFVGEFNGLRASGGFEEWFDCLAEASQYPFRSGADRVAVLITDENGNASKHSLSTALPVVNNNATKVYGISYNNLGNVVQAINQTNGSLFHITDPFDLILDKIADSIVNTYKVSTTTTLPVGQHDLCVEPVFNPNGRDTKPFKVGANPIVALSSATQQLIKDGVQPGTTAFTIEASAIDQDGSVSTVNIIWNDNNNSATTAMSAGSNNAYSFAYNDTANSLQNIGDCFDFSIQAIDNEGRNTTVPADEGNTVGGQWHVCVTNTVPSITDITPSSYEYQKPIAVTAKIVDDQNISNTVATLKYREPGTIIWNTVAMIQAGADTVTGLIPDAAAGFNGLEIEVVAQDAYQAVAAEKRTLTVQNIPVAIVDVTRYADTLDVGPFSVHAVVAGIDLTQQGKVELNYSVNGGNNSTLPMTQAVTGTQSPMLTNSNIYVEAIPSVNAGDKVCYTVTASNPTATASSPEICFDVLQPAEPLALTPASAIVAIGDDPIEFMAKGGYPSYEWSALNGDVSTTLGDKTQYTPKLGGLDKITAKDLKGFNVTAVIKVLPQLAINPPVQGKSFAPNNTVGLTAIGGEPSYEWKIEGATGQASGNDNEVFEISLGNDPATIKVILLDAVGRNTTVEFDNQGQLRIDPTEATMSLDAKKSFTASGGIPPYAWTTIGGDVDDASASTVEYGSPSIAGIYHLMVSDSTGNFANVSIKVGEPFRVTPHCARIQRGDIANFDVVSGVPPYRWEAKYGNLSATAGTSISFTPEANLGLYELFAYDATGSVRNLCVEVAGGLILSRSSLTIKTEQTVSNISVTGGSGSYTWTAERGIINPMTGSTISYTAPAMTGSDTIKVIDNTGQEAVISVQVVGEKIEPLICTPTSVTLAKGGQQQFSCDQTSNLVLSTSAGNIDSNGLFTAPESTGAVTVTATDITRGLSIDMQVQVASQLSLTPTAAAINIADTASFKVAGGEAPYTWRVQGNGQLDASSGDSNRFTPETIGKVDILVMDNQGITATATVEITGHMAITPENATLQPNATISFKANGGTGNITWVAAKGTIDSNGNYTAPVDFGTYQITATDGAGVQASASVRIANVPVASPQMVWLEKGGQTNLSVIGGNTPYTWTASAGQFQKTSRRSAEGNTVIYIAPDVSTDVTITVTDNVGETSTVMAYVDLPLKATREELFLTPGGTSTVAATGGIPPFEWTTIRGEFELVTTQEAAKNIYTAANITGEDTITIRDRKGSTVQVAVKAAAPLTITPSVRYMSTGETKTFQVNGGFPAYTCTVDGEGEIAPAESQDGLISFIAGGTIDQDITINCTDAGNSTVQARVFVDRKLRVSPVEVFLPRGGEQIFKATGGTGSYTVFATSGTADVNTDTGRGIYTTPNRLGNYTVTVEDSSGQTAEVTVTVENSSPVISPATAVMTPGETRTFIVNRGAPSYTWNFEGGIPDVKQGNNADVVQITAPKVAGNYELKAEDITGVPATANIEVVQPLLLSPSTLTVYKGEQRNVRIAAKGAVGGKCDWVTNDQQALTEGADYIVVKPRTDVELGTKYSITCRDQGGNTKRANIIVSQLPGDLNSDGVIDNDEAQNVLDEFFNQNGGDQNIGGVPIDRQKVFVHLELMVSVQ
ncbi:VWA domain-containing protein [Candidatus Venteria ishoeyi]|uniref:VWFA domain-containing protein n=1 Tax=Candidatus Venteria ishoeyi TaxID=1899563 RepID=A0A1H6FIW1_9GAMM|nr:VWA domain-containing protein [Candidatus Venteria ishoeyi]SEH08954.1 Uncharacterised protein [Candidatus Venteria ishoeyi]